jgi:hypothetical protein
MTVSISPYPRFKAFYPGTGNPLSGGFLYTAQPGTTVQFGLPPAYPQPTYTDSTGIVQNLNPVILDANGEADVWLSGYTKLVLYDKDGNLVWSKNNVSSQAQIQPSSLQWVPQTSQVTYVGPTQFSVPGNQMATYLPGTAIMASITGANIAGIVQSSSASGTPIATLVTVSWYSTQLNTSLSAIYTGIVAGGVPGSMPVMPTQAVTANKTANSADLFQTLVVNSANAVSITLPAANSVPPGSWYDVVNGGTTLLTMVGTVNGSANQTLTPFTGERLMSDGALWWSFPNMGPTSGVLAKSTSGNLAVTDLYRQIAASNAANLTLPAANAVPSGAFYDIFNSGSSNATVVGTINGAANLVLTQYAGKRIFSDGSNWYAR